MSSTTVEQVNEPTGEFTSHDTPPKRLGLALFVICAAQLMVVLDGTIVNIALPHIEADLDFSQANLQWVVTGYTLAFGGLLLLGGRLGDLYGRRRMFIMGRRALPVASLVARPRAERGACCSPPVPCRASAPRSPRPPRSR